MHAITGKYFGVLNSAVHCLIDGVRWMFFVQHLQHGLGSWNLHLSWPFLVHHVFLNVDAKVVFITMNQDLPCDPVAQW